MDLNNYQVFYTSSSNFYRNVIATFQVIFALSRVRHLKSKQSQDQIFSYSIKKSHDLFVFFPFDIKSEERFQVSKYLNLFIYQNKQTKKSKVRYLYTLSLVSKELSF